MSRALWLLVFLSVRARYRTVLRGLRSPKGFLLMLLGLGFFSLIIVAPFLAGAQRPEVLPRISMGDGSPVQRFGPAGLLAFTLLSLFASSKNRGIYFSPAEVDFLFQAPFSRRELLGYRLTTQVIHTFLGVLFSSAIFCRYLPGFWQTVAGLFLTFTFINLVQIAGSLLAGAVQERAVARGRRFIGLSLFLVALLVFGGSSAVFRGGTEFREAVRGFLGSPVLGWALLPLKGFAETLAARDLKGFLSWGSLAAAVDLSLLWMVLRLDVDYSEASLETSRRIYQRIREIRSGGRVLASTHKLRIPLPLPPRLWGVGPLAWRQAQEMVREAPAAIYLLVIFSVAVLLPLGFFSDHGGLRTSHFPLSFGILVATLPFMTSSWFRFDFRGDLERMELLLGLPLSPGVVALGQLLVPALILCALQAVGFAAMAALGALEDPGARTIVGFWLLLFGPLNLLFVGIENLFYLLYPIRQGTSGPGDFQTIGRLMVTLAMKMMALGTALFLGFLLAYGAYAAFDGSMAAAAAAATSFLLLCDTACVVLVGWVFARFDVTRPPPD
jgi:ABC-2 type transport system permease protein